MELGLNGQQNKKEEDMENTGLIEKVAHLEERAKSNTIRLNEHDEQIKELNNVYLALTKVDDKVTNVESDVSEIKQDLKDIKEKPAKNWDKLIWIIITRNCNSSSGFFLRKNRIIERKD